MWMTDREIYMSYKSAGETPTQIRILSELNACSQKEIRNAIHRYSKIKKERSKNYQSLMKKNKEEKERSNEQTKSEYKEKSSWVRIESKPKSSIEYQHDVCKTYNIGQSMNIGESHTIYSEPKVKVKKQIDTTEQIKTRRSTMSESTRNPEPTSGVTSRNNIDTTKLVEPTCSTHSSGLSSILIEELKNLLSVKGIEISIKIQTINEDKKPSDPQQIKDNVEVSTSSTGEDVTDDMSSDEKLRWRKRTVIQNDWENDWNDYIDSMRDHLKQAKEFEKQLKKLEKIHGSHRRKVKIKEEKND